MDSSSVGSRWRSPVHSRTATPVRLPAVPAVVPPPSSQTNSLLELHAHMQHAARQRAAIAAAAAAGVTRGPIAMAASRADLECTCGAGGLSLALHSSFCALVRPASALSHGVAASGGTVPPSSRSAPAPLAPAPAPSIVVDTAPPSTSTSPRAAASAEPSLSPLQRGLAYARSLTRLRSSLLSAYACYQWAVEQLGHGDGSRSASSNGALVAEVDTILRQNRHSSSTLLTISRRAATSTSAGGSSRAHAWAAWAEALRRLFWRLFRLWSRHSRRFHRFLRPHLLLLARSRALSRVLSSIAPTLRHSAWMIGQGVFAWGSAWIAVKRFSASRDGRELTMWCVATSALTSLRAQLTQAQDVLRSRWTALSAAQKVACALALLSGAFLASTCRAILREHAERRAQRIDAVIRCMALPPTSTASASSSLDPMPGSMPTEEEAAAWTRTRALLIAEELDLDRAPEPTPDPSPDATPALTPVASQRELMYDGDEEEDATLVDPRRAPPRHAPSFSFHRDCSACIANAVASSAVAAAYTHNHPPRGGGGGGGVSGVFLEEDANDRTDLESDPGLPTTPLLFAHHQRSRTGTGSDSGTPTSSMSSRGALVSLHPLANAIAKRMEWSPSRVQDAASAAAASVNASVAPGTPLPPLPASGVSFVSPASRRLTSIRISRLKHQTQSVERLRHQLRENVRLVYEKQQQQHQQQQELQHPSEVAEEKAPLQQLKVDVEMEHKPFQISSSSSYPPPIPPSARVTRATSIAVVQPASRTPEPPRSMSSTALRELRSRSPSSARSPSDTDTSPHSLRSPNEAGLFPIIRNLFRLQLEP